MSGHFLPNSPKTECNSGPRVIGRANEFAVFNSEELPRPICIPAGFTIQRAGNCVVPYRLAKILKTADCTVVVIQAAINLRQQI
jgi:hypothetical protein